MTICSNVNLQETIIIRVHELCVFKLAGFNFSVYP